MEVVFLRLLNMSITASYLALAVVILRLLLKKAPKWISCALWALVALRLLLPVSLESIFSLIPSAEPIPQQIVTVAPTIQTGIPVVDQTVNPILQNSASPQPGDSVNPMQVVVFIASSVWLAGAAVILVYAAVSYLRLHRRVRESIETEKGIRICDRIAAPFILGVFCPVIYLPSGMDQEDARYVIAHEKAHLQRRDHWWKPLGFALLSVYWFNPVFWVAYVLLCRDIELACDEKVIRQMGEESKKPYSQALLNCSVPRKMIAACPLAFGEVGVKGRIKSVLNYKKPAFWIILVAIIAGIVVAVCFLTNPKAEPSKVAEKETQVWVGVSEYIDYVTENENAQLSREDAMAAATILQSDGWMPGVDRTMCYFIFKVEEKEYHFSPDAKLVNDYEQDACLFLTDAQNDQLVILVDYYIYGVEKPEPQALLIGGVATVYASPVGEEQLGELDLFTLRYTALNKDELLTISAILSREGWNNDYNADRISFQFDGELSVSGTQYEGIIYFGFENKVIYYDHYYTTMTDADQSLLRDICARAELIPIENRNSVYAQDSGDALAPYFVLYDTHARMGRMVLSSALYCEYTLADGKLVMESGTYRYVFYADGKDFVYSAKDSAPTTNYEFEDGTVFVLEYGKGVL